jgi:hypothetical protein
MLMRGARLKRVKAGDAKACAPSRKPIAIISDVTFECEFGSGKQTYRDIRLSLAAKPRVDVPWKLVVTSVSPTLAGRNTTVCGL